MTSATRSKPAPRFVSDSAKWAAVGQRDAEADGQFYYSVRTTGVYCRPSCASRLARRENVRFHATCNEAERAGFRPCRRCRPNEQPLAAQHATTIAAACRTIEASDQPPDLDALAGAAELSRSHFQRLFKAMVGVTPKAYATALRARRTRDQLQRSDSVTSTIYGAGFSSNSRFYETTSALLGMTPTRFRAGGAGTKIRFAVGQCSLGAILVAASEKGICSISLGDDADALVVDLQEQFPKAELLGGEASFEQWVAQVVGFVDNPAIGLDLPLDIRGTAFQQRVWQALRAIPLGETLTYSELAQRLGSPQVVRAVAHACASNRLAVAIPCHRVVRVNGDLAGYRWGIERKRALLNREAEG